MISLSIVIPTCGRETLENTLGSVLSQLQPQDEVLVVSDGEQPRAREIVSAIPEAKPSRSAQIRYFEHLEKKDGEPFHCWGHPQRNFAFSKVRGTHVASIDDDDIYTPDALESFRWEACNRPVIFKMQYPGAHSLWQKKGLLECGNFGTPCTLVPKIKGLPFPRYGDHYAGDFDFVYEAVQIFGQPVWSDKVVALLRPEG